VVTDIDEDDENSDNITAQRSPRSLITSFWKCKESWQLMQQIQQIQQSGQTIPEGQLKQLLSGNGACFGQTRYGD
jgi:hypothetical protein